MSSWTDSIKKRLEAVRAEMYDHTEDGTGLLPSSKSSGIERSVSEFRPTHEDNDVSNRSFDNSLLLSPTLRDLSSMSGDSTHRTGLESPSFVVPSLRGRSNASGVPTLLSPIPFTPNGLILASPDSYTGENEGAPVLLTPALKSPLNFRVNFESEQNVMEAKTIDYSDSHSDVPHRAADSLKKKKKRMSPNRHLESTVRLVASVASNRAAAQKAAETEGAKLAKERLCVLESLPLMAADPVRVFTDMRFQKKQQNGKKNEAEVSVPRNPPSPPNASPSKPKKLEASIPSDLTTRASGEVTFSTSSQLPLTYGSIVALETLDGWVLSVHPVTGDVSLREPPSTWDNAAFPHFPLAPHIEHFSEAPRTQAQTMAAAAACTSLPLFLFRVVNLLDPTSVAVVRECDPVWLVIHTGRGMSSQFPDWRVGSVLGVYLQDPAASASGNTGVPELKRLLADRAGFQLAAYSAPGAHEKRAKRNYVMNGGVAMLDSQPQTPKTHASGAPTATHSSHNTLSKKPKRVNPLDRVGMRGNALKPIPAHVPLFGTPQDFLLGPPTASNATGTYFASTPGYDTLFGLLNTNSIYCGKWNFVAITSSLTEDRFSDKKAAFFGTQAAGSAKTGSTGAKKPASSSNAGMELNGDSSSRRPRAILKSSRGAATADSAPEPVRPPKALFNNALVALEHDWFRLVAEINNPDAFVGNVPSSADSVPLNASQSSLQESEGEQQEDTEKGAAEPRDVHEEVEIYKNIPLHPSNIYGVATDSHVHMRMPSDGIQVTGSAETNRRHVCLEPIAPSHHQPNPMSQISVSSDNSHSIGGRDGKTPLGGRVLAPPLVTSSGVSSHSHANGYQHGNGVPRLPHGMADFADFEQLADPLGADPRLHAHSSAPSTRRRDAAEDPRERAHTHTHQRLSGRSIFRIRVILEPEVSLSKGLVFSAGSVSSALGNVHGMGKGSTGEETKEPTEMLLKSKSAKKTLSVSQRARLQLKYSNSVFEQLQAVRKEMLIEDRLRKLEHMRALEVGE